MPEQRKMITALFCDLVGSTELSGALEPETLRSVMIRYFDAMRGGIEVHGGTVEKFIGDAVMAVFGVPVVHEDDAYRATAAALDMMAALSALNAELDEELGSTLAIRIGINTGEAVTSGSDSREAMVSGEAVNVAARLEQNAEPGQILLGPTTRTLLGNAARVEPVGALTLRGKQEPVEAYRLLGLGGARGAGPGLAARTGVPFTGRAAEYGQLTAAWDEVRSGAVRLVEVTGVAGAGKTRLLDEFTAHAVPGGAVVGAGRCHPYLGESSLMPLADALRAILGAAAAPGPGGPDGPAWRVLRGGLLADGTPSPSAEATWAAAAAVLAGAAAARPVILVVDDLQWARPMLREGIARLRDALTGVPVLLLCAGRPRHDTAFLPGSARVRLGRLPDAAAHAMAAALTAGWPPADRPPAPVLDALVARAEGNPLHLEQLLTMVGDGADPATLPATVTAVLSARIDTLGPGERSVLDAGAVVGRRFTAAAVRRLVRGPAPNGSAATGPTPTDAAAGPGADPPDPPDHVAVALPVLLRRGLVEAVPGAPGTYQFSAGLLHEVAYHCLTKQQRAQWHEQLADAPAVPPHLTAHHTEQAYLHRRQLGRRDPGTDRLRRRAAEALCTAGRHALARADLPWSADLHERSLGLSVEEDRQDTVWARSALGLGETWLALGRTDEGADLLRRALRAAGASGDELTGAHARLQLAALTGGMTAPGSVHAPTPSDAARAGLDVFRAAGDRLGLSRAYVRLAQEQQLDGRHAAAEELLSTALGHAVAAGAAPERAMALGALGVSLWQGPTPAHEAVQRCRALLAEHGTDHIVAVVTLNYPLASLLALSGRIDEARACLVTAGQYAEGLGYAEVAALAPLFAGGVEALGGDPREAERLLRQAVAASRRVGGATLLATASRDLARLLLLRGARPGVALLGTGTQALTPADTADDLGVRALDALAAGDPGTALVLASRAVEAAQSTDSPITRAAARLDLARAARAAGHPGTARRQALRAAALFAAKGHAVGHARALALAGVAHRDGAAAHAVTAHSQTPGAVPPVSGGDER